MSKEQDEYWTIDQAIGGAHVAESEHIIRLRMHTAKERYEDKQALVPLKKPRGARIYFHARPYILLPDIKLTIGVYPEPQGSKIGEVLSSEWEGMKHQEIGNCQAWHYPSDRLLIIWEGYLFDHYRQPDPVEDQALAALWAGFESLLIQHAKGVERIATPSWEPIYEQGTLWQNFLYSVGYRPFNERAFAKKLVRLALN